MLLSKIIDTSLSRDIDIADIVLDSKLVTYGSAFFAVPGSITDGRDYFDEAISRGAIAIVYETDSYNGRAIPDTISIGVCNLKQKLSSIAQRFCGYERTTCKLIGVTGTNGKTSVALLLQQLFMHFNVVAGYIGTLGWGITSFEKNKSSLTSPDIFSFYKCLRKLVDKQCQWVVVEASSHALDQNRLHGVHFNYGIFTNLSRDHFDYHQNYDDYFQAKKKLFNQCNKAVINFDDNFGNQLKAELNLAEILGYSINNYDKNKQTNTYAQKIELNISGSSFFLHNKAGTVHCKTQLIGSIAVSNIVAATVILLDLGYRLSDMPVAIEKLQTPKGRLEKIPSNQHIFIDFAHTPSALEVVMKEFNKFIVGRLWLIFGCGGDRDVGKRPLMGKIASQHADVIILTNDNPRTENPSQIIIDIMKGISNLQNVYVIEDRSEAIKVAIMKAKKDDCVLIAGKGHETGQIIGDKVYEYSDFQVVQKLLS